MAKRRKPTEVPPAVRTHPTPKRCPRCKSRRIVDLGVTPGGVFPWTCGACRAIGYDDRIVGAPLRNGSPSPEGARRSERSAEAAKIARTAAKLDDAR
jgi:hypothetical protein